MTSTNLLPWQMTAALWLWKYPPLVILTLALVGNTLSFAVISRPSLARSSVSVYLRVVAVTDTVTVVFGYLPPLLEQWANFSIETIHNTACVLRRFVMFFAGDCSVWLIAAISIDRAIVVARPLKARRLCTKRRALCAVLFLMILSGLKNFPTLFTLGLVETVSSAEENFTRSTRSCTAKMKYRSYEYNIRPWISLVLYYICTTLLIIIANTLIIYHMKKASTARTHLDAANTQTGTSGDANASRSLTRMMIAITLLFVCLITPTMVIWTAVGSMSVATEEDRAKVLLFFAFTDILAFLNHSINFLLYICSGPRFRREFYALFCPCHLIQREKLETQMPLGNVHEKYDATYSDCNEGT